MESDPGALDAPTAKTCWRCEETAAPARLMTCSGAQHVGYRCARCGAWVGGFVSRQRLRALGVDIQALPAVPSATRRAAEEQPRLF